RARPCRTAGRGRRPGQGRPRRSRSPRTPPAREDSEARRGREALLALSDFEQEPNFLEDAPPTTDRPGRFRLLRLVAIDIRPLRESRDYRLPWCGQAISAFGNMATFVAVPYQLYSLTGSALQVGLLSICDAVPLLAFAAFGGTVADRFDRRKIALWTDIGLMG